MDLPAENIYMIGICFAAVLFLFFVGPLKFIFKILLRASFGLVAIYFINIFLCSAMDLKKLCIGMNFLTAGISAVLGFPGILFLYITQSVL